MTKKRWTLIFLFLPAILLLGWFLVEQVQVWTAPEPRWVISVSDQEDFPSCQSAEAFVLETFDVHPVEEGGKRLITAERAGDFISRILGFFPIHDEPTLAEATFPDGQRRLVWYRFDLVDTGQHDMEGQVPCLFIDALSGEPLLLVTDLVVFDPCMAGCDCLSAQFSIFRFSRNQVIALTLLIPSLLISGIILWLRRRGKGDQEEDSGLSA